LYVFLLAAAVAALAWAWQFESPPPDLMDDLAAAAGLRPPTGPHALLWYHIAAPLCRYFGLQTAGTILRTAGHVSLGLLALLVTALLRTMLTKSFQRGERIAAWWGTAVRFVLFQGTALFCLSDPVWNAFRWFSPLALQVVLVALAAVCYAAYFKADRKGPLFVAFALIGLLSADTPVGAVLLVLAIFGRYVKRRLCASGVLPASQGNPLADVFMAWRLTLAFVFGVGAGVALEVYAFASADGLAAFGWTWGDYAYRFPVTYVKALLETCSPAGVVIFTAVVVLPVLIAFKLVRLSTDEEKPLTYYNGAMFVAFGFVALAQFSGARSLWFWTWAGETGCVHDGILKCTAMFLCALVVVWALAVFTMELYLRNFRRVETLRFQDEAEAEGAAAAFAMARRLQRIVRTCLLVEPLLVFACVVPFRMQRMERAMLAVVADAAHETAEECRGAEYLFTDGGLDAAVELAAAASGHRLYALSMMGGADDPREIYLRTRSVEDARDKALLERGAPDALRTWVRSHPDKASTYAVQIGFELWQRDKRPMPECSGLVARPAGFAPGEVERGAEAARELAKRLLALYDEGAPGGIADRSLRDAFLFVQWRLAVLARHRANAYDGRGEVDSAMEETRLADALDKRNEGLARIHATMSWASKKRLERMTPQEGLRLGIFRADFALARPFALSVLEITPDDPTANFALGMYFFTQEQYARAQAYLERCNKSRPDDPAVLNNLAQCRLRLGDPAGALPYAERAQTILLDSPEIKRTLERVKAELEKKKGGDQAR
jgi:tetratricopeptide (TPR) repeat protein